MTDEMRSILDSLRANDQAYQHAVFLWKSGEITFDEVSAVIDLGTPLYRRLTELEDADRDESNDDWKYM